MSADADMHTYPPIEHRMHLDAGIATDAHISQPPPYSGPSTSSESAHATQATVLRRSPSSSLDDIYALPPSDEEMFIPPEFSKSTREDEMLIPPEFSPESTQWGINQVEQDTLKTDYHASAATSHEQQWPTRASYSSSPPQGGNGFSARAWAPQPTFANKNPLQPDLCVVCKKAPPYSKAGKFYPTCGLTCAGKLQRLEPRNRRADSSMCIVCRSKPRAAGYMTCGYTCSAKLETPATSPGMCEFCGVKPKLVNRTTGKSFPHCGRSCRDQAEAATQVVKGTCNTCVVCWKNSSPSAPCCSESCREMVEAQAPNLVEVPRGHSHFYTVSDEFEKQWDMIRHDRPTISHIYFVVPSKAVRDRNKTFKSNLSGRLRKRLSESKRWLGTTKQCDIGDSGQVSLCNDPYCMLCNIVLNGVQPNTYGAQTFLNSDSADGLFDNGKNFQWRKAMFFLDVVSDKEVEMTRQQFMTPPPDTGTHGHSFVRIVKYGKFGNKEDTGELFVREPDAMVPKYLIVYS